MADKPTRVGGVRVDPAVAAFQRSAATNVAALSRKQIGRPARGVSRPTCRLK